MKLCPKSNYLLIEKFINLIVSEVFIPTLSLSSWSMTLTLIKVLVSMIIFVGSFHTTRIWSSYYFGMCSAIFSKAFLFLFWSFFFSSSPIFCFSSFIFLIFSVFFRFYLSLRYLTIFEDQYQIKTHPFLFFLNS